LPLVDCSCKILTSGVKPRLLRSNDTNPTNERLLAYVQVFNGERLADYPPAPVWPRGTLL